MCIKTFYLAFTSFLLTFIICILGTQNASAANKAYISTENDQTWSNNLNWGTGAAPINGDVVSFFSGSYGDTYLRAENDISGLRLNGLTFTGSGADGVSLLGNSITLKGTIYDDNSGGGGNLVNMNIGALGAIGVYKYELGYIVFIGDLWMGKYDLALRSYDSTLILIDGNIFGTGRIYVVGNGIGVLLTDIVTVTQSTQVSSGGRLLGSGTTGSLTVASTGFLVPDECIPKKMTTKNFVIDGTFESYVTRNDICPNGLGRIIVKGKVDIGGAILKMDTTRIDPGHALVKGAKYVLINNDGTDPVIGTFRWLREGAWFSKFRITYHGGTGNDVVLTVF